MDRSGAGPVAALDGRHIVLGVSGGIAAYKSIELCRRLVDAGAYVSPVLTRGALRFVGETTFSALASERARTSLFDDADPIPHTSLGQKADLIVVAPATARVLAAYAVGLSNDLLTATLLATRARVVVAPAMHTEMWEHPAVQANVATLRERGVTIVEPEQGRLAGGDIGTGRLASTAAIIDGIVGALLAGGDRRTADLAGLHVLVTAGGTREPIDPVRFIGNRSSGRQGHAVAVEAAERGALVTLVSTTPPGATVGIDVVRVETAAEMEREVTARAQTADIVIMAAAVADYRPVDAATEKLKKDSEPLTEIRLEPTPDILARLGVDRRAGQTLVGFAAETTDARANGERKLASKGADMIVVNDVSAPGVGFEHETNAVVILCGSGRVVDVPLCDKRIVARTILDTVLSERAMTDNDRS